MKALVIFGFTLGLAALASMFAYSGFGYEWWQPIPSQPINVATGRITILIFFHMAALLIGAISLAVVIQASQNRRPQ